MSKKTTGQLGENLACEYLVHKGYNILRQNWRTKGGEIDIIAKTKDRIVVFVEVKTFSGPLEAIRDLLPEDNITSAKLKKLRRACEMFVARNPEFIDEKKGWRIDVVAIELPPGKEPTIRHYENV